MRALGVFAIAALLLAAVLVWFTYGSNSGPRGGALPTANVTPRTEAPSPLDTLALTRETGPKTERTEAGPPGSQEVPTPPEQVTPESSSVPILPEDLSEENPYSGMTIAELRGEETKLRTQVYELTKPIYEELRKAGRFEVVGTLENHVLDTPKDNSLLVSFQYEGSTGQMRRIVIPEEEYPAPYVLWRRLLLIAQEIRRKTGG